IPVVDVTETLPAGTTDYVGWIGKEVDALSKALVKQ
ncbi:MAG TPA: metal ABC transporter substrate-binding protein, partial [Kutzneria sp.]|nr:metal ABC transporter substrate-binding protein [Kutzneria sp.]